MKKRPNQHTPDTKQNSAIQAPESGEIAQDPGSDHLISIRIDEQYVGKLEADALHRLAIGVLRAESKAGPLEMGIVVTTDEEVQALNRRYLGHDYKTDVISFGMESEQEFITPAERPAYLGDVVISYDRAAEQAPDYGHSPEREVATLMVHGILHLLGYDDQDDPSRHKMHARQDQLCVILDFGLWILD